jgi:hypothetical protein
MTDIEKLQRDIDRLKESIALNRTNLHQRTSAELQDILKHTGWCMAELEELAKELNRRLNSN